MTTTLSPTSPLLQISPLDGRYASKLDVLRTYFSEFNLIRMRVLVEVRWLIALANCQDIPQCPSFSAKEITQLDQLIDNFSLQDAEQIKTIEKTTRHDVKAVEYFLREKLSALKIDPAAQNFLHFACTSEDINNLAYALMIQQAMTHDLIPLMGQLSQIIAVQAKKWAPVAMLARTHGQPATPTTMGKEWANVAYRLNRQIQHINNTPHFGKCNGAVGNYNAHVIAYPHLDWPIFCQQFVESLGLVWNPYTTQVEPHDGLAELFHAVIRLNTILIDFARDSWSYISLDYFKQTTQAGEVGSSTMPHKINPIDFENAEGNLGLSSAVLQHLAQQLPVSRFQRDLSGSTVMRNIGVALAHAALAYQSLIQGIQKLNINEDAMQQELNQHWEILAEAAQTILRREGVSDAYEQLKALSQGKQCTQADWEHWVEQLAVSDQTKTELHALRPETYLGKAVELGKKV